VSASADYQRQQMQQRAQPHYAAQAVGSNFDLNNAIMENRQRAAQLSQQINKQKASQQAKPKNSRAANANVSNNSGGLDRLGQNRNMNRSRASGV
jgi:uncharacterized small protein (DUF1192 family)